MSRLKRAESEKIFREKKGREAVPHEEGILLKEFAYYS